MSEDPELAAILEAFPEPAILLDREYRICLANKRYRDTYGLAAAPEPQHCFRVSHGYAVPCDQAGESCPLRQSLDTARISRALHIHHTPRGDEYVNVEMWPIADPETNEIRYFIERMHPSTTARALDGDRALVGRAPAFLRMLDLVERVAPTDSTVMLLGETGTGKEVVAETIHRLSSRRALPFVPVECTGLPESLFESELFGYVRGAFTGATSNRSGLVEAASGGTLFLDEVGEVPLADQVKLLRLLETRRFRRVGSNEWQTADFRLICATNQNLGAMVEAGRFRRDLYYRLNVFEIELPPLRERIEDLELLVSAVLKRLGRTDLHVSEEALQALARYAFPGNIRELRNIVERATLLTDDLEITPRHLPTQCQNTAAAARGVPGEEVVPLAESYAGVPGEDVVPLAEAERRYLLHAVQTYRGDRRSLAKALGISERALYRKLAAARQ